jgi:UDP:flavonoid glycosyltransferase YjiC (YdhE family)
MVPGQFFQESIRAIGQLQRRAVLLVGQNPLPPDLPENIIACDYVQFSQIFPRAAVIVHQGALVQQPKPSKPESQP